MALGSGLQGPLPAAQRGVAGESVGMIPNEEQLLNIESRHDLFTPIIMGIGQGPIAWTPLQAANAFATLARGGEIRDAHIVRDAAALPPDRRTGKLDMPPEACRRALEGLRQAVEENMERATILNMVMEAKSPSLQLKESPCAVKQVRRRRLRFQWTTTAMVNPIVH